VRALDARRQGAVDSALRSMFDRKLCGCVWEERTREHPPRRETTEGINEVFSSPASWRSATLLDQGGVLVVRLVVLAEQQAACPSGCAYSRPIDPTAVTPGAACPLP